MDKTLIISPQSGLGNRLRAMAAAIIIAEQTNRRLYHAWTPSTPTDARPHVAPLQNLGFEHFFKFSEHIRPADKIQFPIIDMCFSEWLPNDGWYAAQSTAQSQWECIPLAKRFFQEIDPLATSRAEVILLETSHATRLSPSMGGYTSEQEWLSAMHKAYTHLTPKQPYLNLLSNYETVDIGIHIRRGDMLQFFAESRQNLSDLLNWAFALSQHYTIAIFTDDNNLKQIFTQTISKHGGRIRNPAWPESIQIAEWELGFVEFLYLALKCKIVCGTPASSFSKEAAIYGNKPYFRNLTNISK